MKKAKRKLSVKAGLPPGSMVHIGMHQTEKASLHVFHYNEQGIEEKFVERPSDLKPFLNDPGHVTWLNVIGVNHLAVVEEIGEVFGIHTLILEDIVNQEQRPKFEDYGEYNFLTLRTLLLGDPYQELSYSQVSLLFGSNYVLSFQEKEHDLFNTVRQRLINGASRARSRGPDFLVYLLTDCIVDAYFAISEVIADSLDDIEDSLIANDQLDGSVFQLHALRRNMSVILKSAYPLREGLSRLERRDIHLVKDETLIFFRDIYDHVVHITESIENQRDVLAGIMDIYLTNQNNRLNAIMKVLTIISTVFIPLSFFASVYGMNFRNLPELSWKYGYLYFWCICFVSVILMVLFFRRKKWL